MPQIPRFGIMRFAREGGVCGTIFRAAGHAEMQIACEQIGGCETGKAVITDGFALPAKYVIHVVGPAYQPNDQEQHSLLHSCYLSALEIAVQYQLHSITFPLISAGIYGYPKEEAVEIALDAILTFLQSIGNELEITLELLQYAQEKAACWGK